jgi:hypothetical protein
MLKNFRVRSPRARMDRIHGYLSHGKLYWDSFSSLRATPAEAEGMRCMTQSMAGEEILDVMFQEVKRNALGKGARNGV